MIENPFVLKYKGPEYFCDRARELDKLKEHLVNGRDVIIASPRRIGKSGLIHRLFDENDVRAKFNCIFVDIYCTNSLKEFAESLIRGFIEESQKPFSYLAHLGAAFLKSLGITLDSPHEIRLANWQDPSVTIEQVFKYLDQLDRPTVIAVDEFQQIAAYKDGSAEALLRTLIQNSRKVHLIYAGSEQHLLQEMFRSASRPFYMSASLFALGPINQSVYFRFVKDRFNASGRDIDEDAFDRIYLFADGKTGYIQRWLNQLFTMTSETQKADLTRVHDALTTIIEDEATFYEDEYYRVSASQRELLTAMALEKGVEQILSKAFLSKYGLTASAVQSACRSLNAKGLHSRLLQERSADGSKVWKIADVFFAEWLRRRAGSVRV